MFSYVYSQLILVLIFLPRTFNPLSNEQKILSKLEEVAEELEKDMEESGWAGKTITLKYKLDTYQGNHTCFL